MNFKLCVVVGAGSGLGLSIAQRFGKEGYASALIARRAVALEEYTNTLMQTGVTAKGFNRWCPICKHKIKARFY